MIVLQNLLHAVARLINMAANIYIFILFVRAIISWFSPDPYSDIYMLLMKITEPVLSRIREVLNRFIPTTGIDFSPFVAIVLIELIVKNFIVFTLYQI